jgi:hypothetical protein
MCQEKMGGKTKKEEECNKKVKKKKEGERKQRRSRIKDVREKGNRKK